MLSKKVDISVGIIKNFIFSRIADKKLKYIIWLDKNIIAIYNNHGSICQFNCKYLITEDPFPNYYYLYKKDVDKLIKMLETSKSFKLTSAISLSGNVKQRDQH